MLDRKERAVFGPHSGALWIAVPNAPEGFVPAVGLRVACRNAAIRRYPHHPSRQILRILGAIHVAAIAQGHEQIAVNADGNTRSEMPVGGIEIVHPEYDALLFQPPAITLEQKPGRQ